MMSKLSSQPRKEVNSALTSLRLAVPWSSLRSECIRDMDTLDVLLSPLRKECWK
jgi:hypothetical protein